MKFTTTPLIGLAMLMAAGCGENGAADAAVEGNSASRQAEKDDAETDAGQEAQTDDASAKSEPDYAAAPSGLYNTDAGHRYITFTYLHQGFSSPYLRWNDWDGELNWNAENPEASSIAVTIDAASIDSGVDEFDNHLKSADFFEVEKFPSITFESTEVKMTGPNTGVVTGDLTIRDQTKPVAVDVTFNKAAYVDRAEAHKIGFSGKTTLLRSDFGVGRYAPVVGDEVTIIIETEFDEVKSAE